MKNHKSHKIKEALHESGEDLNLHEIKARTGAGNGYKHHTHDNVETEKKISGSNVIHKSHKITDVINEHDGNLNLHEIKAKTGAGSGHKHHHHNDNTVTQKDQNVFNKTYKSDKIKDVIEEHDGDLNLHEIKAKTGAGSGHKH